MEKELPSPVLIVVAHPDDAEFGFAGTIATWAPQGVETYYLVCTRGDKGSSDPTMTSDRLAPIREAEQRAAAQSLGVKDVDFLDWRDGELEPSLRLKEQIVRYIRLRRPRAVFTTDPTTLIHRNEFINHSDHRAVGLATVDAVYPLARDHLHFPDQLKEGLEPHKVAELYLTVSEQPNYWVDISDTLDKKMAALRCHTSQFPDFGMVEEFVRRRAETAGQEHGCKYAESFRRIALRI